ncbi:alpha-amylase family glycosyl hydrolase [Acidothermaceae bacterium B102]|nr:alpha-amylase family glycosyl hydrolase [Acidothermaceae bacterium B102]
MVGRYDPRPEVLIEHPPWTRSATIYQINVRQLTEAGTLRAAQEHLPRIRSLGVDIVWLMPINPIGEVNRKGALGSPYAVRDYYGVNPELGTHDDVREFVERAHQLGLYVILDWVANHTAWDNVLVASHPEWYSRNTRGELQPTPWWDWDDVVDLDYRHPELREYMTEAMRYWVTEFDFDGYRCDVAGFVPTDFWNNVRAELDAIKPVFMLAEWESRDLHAEAFDMTYAWSWQQSMREIAQGQAGLEKLLVYYSWNEKAFPDDAIRMTFVSNHDQNSAEGTDRELFGDALEATIALSVVGDGMPLLYNGQEAGNDKRLEFFERDPIVWREHPVGELYRSLFALKRTNTALANGRHGATMVQVVNTDPQHVFSFERHNDVDGVFAVFNFGPESTRVAFPRPPLTGEFVDYLTGAPIVLDGSLTLDLGPWDYRVYVAASGCEPSAAAHQPR